MDVKIESSWNKQLEEEIQKPYFVNLAEFIHEEYKTKTIFPPINLVFNAFNYTPFENVKVILLGQDPYHGDGQAHGLSFSVNDGVRIPPSLVNMYKEINRDLGGSIPKSGNLTHWAEQGVLLLNATLTVVAHTAGSHQGKGWEIFTDAIIKKLADERENLVFLLWGAYAQKKAALIDERKHLILKTVHPSPLSAYRGFIGCGHFSKTNEYLISKGVKPIVW